LRSNTQFPSHVIRAISVSQYSNQQEVFSRLRASILCMIRDGTDDARAENGGILVGVARHRSIKIGEWGRFSGGCAEAPERVFFGITINQGPRLLLRASMSQCCRCNGSVPTSFIPSTAFLSRSEIPSAKLSRGTRPKIRRVKWHHSRAKTRRYYQVMAFAP